MIRRSLIYFSLLSLSLYGIRLVHHRILLSQKQGYYRKYSEAFLERNSYNTLFLGSSRAEMHYAVRVIDSLSGWNSFNLGIAGASPKISYHALKIYLKRSAAPERLFMELDLHHLRHSDSRLMDFNNFFPYLKDPDVRRELSALEPRMGLFYYMPYYSLPFTGIRNLSTALHILLGIPNQSDHMYYKGHVAEDIFPSLKFIPSQPEPVFLSRHNREYLDSLVQLCKFHNIRLSFVSSPVFAGGRLDFRFKAELLRELRNYAAAKGLDYYDLSSLPFCRQRELFIDHQHLNARGAELFSRYFVQYVNNN